MTVRLREATIDDRDAVVAVFLDCWRRSYSDVLPQGTINAMTDARATALWNGLLLRPVTTVVVAEDEGTVIGVARFDTHGATGNVHSLYVSPDAHGSGVGTRLLQHATTTMRAGGARILTLWVFAGNVASLQFYRGRGWLPDGGSRIQEEFGEPELRLRLLLEATTR